MKGGNVLREQSKQIQYAVKKCSNSFRSSTKASAIHQQDRQKHTLVTLERVHTNTHKQSQWRVSFYLPAQISRSASYEGSITLLALQASILWGRYGGPQITTASLHRWTSSSSAVCTHSQKPSPCVWEAARGVLWVCKSVRESERRQGQSVRSSGGNTESVFRMHRWRQCGGSDVAGIITGWRSIWNIWDRGSPPPPPLCFFKHRALTRCSSHAPLY